MKITDMRVMRLSGPLVHGQGGDEGDFSKFIIRIDAENGQYGLGEAEDFLGVREGLEYIRALIVGRSIFDIRPLVSEVMYGTVPPHDQHLAPTYDPHRFASACPPVRVCSPTATTIGPICWAASGVDMALCDLVGKVARMPVYALLGGKFRDHAKVYLDRSAPDGAEARELAGWERMGRAVAESEFKMMKFDVECLCADATTDFWNRALTLQQLRLIVDRLKAVREAAGWDVDVCIDCHMHYNAPDAIRLANELAPLKLTWMEDPTPIVNPDAAAEIRDKCPIPICLGEMFTSEQFRLFIDRKAVDILHPDVLFTGGLLETHRIGQYAELHYLPMAMHGNGGSLATIAAAHVAAATRNFLVLEYHFIETEWVSRYVRREGVPLFRHGAVPLTDAPGLGVTLDEPTCRKYLAPGQRFF